MPQHMFRKIPFFGGGEGKIIKQVLKFKEVLKFILELDEEVRLHCFQRHMACKLSTAGKCF